jgi:hypothetical protein
MQCPNCQADNEDDAAICVRCNEILDAGAFDDAPQRPQARPAARPGTKPGVKKVAKKPAAAAPAKKPQARPAGRADTDPGTGAPAPAKKKDWRDELSQEDWEQGQPKQPVKVETGPEPKAIDADAVLSDMKKFVVELSMADKIAFFGLLAMVLSTVLPWKVTVIEGDVLGLLSEGILVAGLALMGIASIVIRVRKTMENMSPVIFFAVQLGALGLALIWCVYFTVSSWDSTMAHSQVGNQMVMASRPSFGVFMAFLAGGVGGLGTVLGLKELKL